MIMIDGTPAHTLVARMRELGLIAFRPSRKEPDAAVKEHRRAKQRECMARLRAKRRERRVAA